MHLWSRSHRDDHHHDVPDDDDHHLHHDPADHNQHQHDDDDHHHDDDDPPTTTSTTIPLITEGATIIVANASGVTGAAALLGQELGSLGFHVFDITNAAGVEERLDVSKVYYLPAGADVATSIGRVMGGILVARMPVPVSITGGPA